MNITVVIPTIREDCIQKWIREWGTELSDARIIIVEDNPEPTFDSGDIEHYSWRDFAFDLGDDAWIIPRRTSACRSYGFLKALESNTDIIWTLDDDCYPEAQVKGHYLEILQGILTSEVKEEPWWNTLEGTGLYPRGFPYDIRGTSPVMLHHGLWSNIPDLDGITQLDNPDFRLPPWDAREIVPSGKFFPMCIMNVAFRREMAPLMYMLLMGKDDKGEPWGYDRFDDIWAGIFVKLAADRLGFAITSGAPGVHHSRASDPHKNAQLEAAGIETHEDLWSYLRDAELIGSTTPAECYAEFAEEVQMYDGTSPREDYWDRLSEAMKIWVQQVAQRL